MGKCLGSSASFNTVLAASLLFITGDSASTIEGKLEEVNRISKVFESVEHGTPSGIDNFVSTYGGIVLFNNSKSPPFKAIKDEAI